MDKTFPPAWQALGLTPTDREIYLAVLGGAGTAEAVQTSVGHDAEQIRISLETLREVGLINSGADGGVVAGKPLVTLRRAAARLQGLAGDLLADSAELQHLHDATNVPDRGRPDVQVLSSLPDVQRAFADLLSGAEREVLACVKPPFLATGDFTDDEAGQLDRGVRFRVIYSPSAVELMGGAAQFAEMVRAGEQARVTDGIPLKMFLVDGRRGLLLAEGSEPESAILVSGSGLVAALVALFESVWTRAWDLADPPPPEGVPVDERDRHIISALRLGGTDDGIAHRLGITTRTVGRRLARLHDLTGTRTRFQLGWRLATLMRGEGAEQPGPRHTTGPT